MVVPIRQDFKESVRIFSFEARHFSTELLTPNAAGFPLEAATSVRSDSNFDGVKETVEPLVGFCDSPLKLGKMLAAWLGTLLPPVDDTGEDGFQPLGLEQAFIDIIGNQMVQLTRRDRAALAAGLAPPRLDRAGVIAVCLSCASLISAWRHGTPHLAQK
ncbi:hypothetical protein QEZ48_15590 [Aquamicrobium lusatiense]|uniref:hypothetical protein n=1 Tax=Aquamicrobium lusatiense TaxID=89772 RepID=UPI0024556071|nr:hypothetical protein [Aquamicrobium lusatiense]MDH4992240.1 hypothetical protein [Aquamicrobium lusatiense]